MASSQPDSTWRTSRRTALAAIGTTGALGLAGCIGLGQEGDEDGGELSGDINIAGSSTVYPLMFAFAEAFQGNHDGVNIDVSRTGSGGGFQNHFCPGKTDFNNASRPIKDEEKQLCEDNGVEWIELQVATDALTVVVNNEADFVDCLTVDELKQIWQPDAAETWAEVRDGFPDEEIERYGAAETSGTFDYFTENVVGEAGAHTDDYQATEQDNTIVQGVQGSEYAIGYFGFSYYYNNPDVVKALKIDDGDGCVEPSLETAASGEYTPLARPLFTYPSTESLGEEHVAEFARYVVEQTTNEDLVAGDVGYVPLTDDLQSQMQSRLEDAIDQAQG
ncbi:phosphate ABC transporter substrate-binding protein [Halobacteriales archaeon QS_1_68_20]|nr:MAG: phosphate ABC transporter substrate-binding protein [Halobacteriales archaeon QS_1_68_20]